MVSGLESVPLFFLITTSPGRVVYVPAAHSLTHGGYVRLQSLDCEHTCGAVGNRSLIWWLIILELLDNWSLPSWWALIKPQSHGMCHNLWLNVATAACWLLPHPPLHVHVSGVM